LPNFDIIKSSEISRSYRSMATIGQYDLDIEKTVERFIGNINFGDDWSIGVIHGNSGTGKSTIAKHLFSSDYIVDFQHSSLCVLDDFDKEIDIKTLHKTLNSVGFSSPPSWLKPYSVLSTGEKMRVDIAMAILSKNDLIVFDEFTSVVDRTVAKIGSAAISKAIKKSNKKFIAVTCHSDILEWIEPDWTFDTNTMTFENTRGRLRRPEIKIDIFEKREMWNLFRKYHYLSNDINKSSKQYVAFIDNVPVAFCAVLPMMGFKGMRKEHRTVVLPDYQGIGIGSAISDVIAKKYTEMGYRYRSVTSNPAFIHHRKKSKNWILCDQGRKSPHTKDGMQSSSRRRTTAWEYVL
jgi:ABC-type ATPase involved in cell division/GNAT superfamily N-acetyltransferase